MNHNNIKEDKLKLIGIQKRIETEKGEKGELELQALDFAIELLDLIEKWGLGKLSIEELDKWRDRVVQHVRWVGEFDAGREKHAIEALYNLQKKLDIEFNNARETMEEKRQELGQVEAVIQMMLKNKEE